MSSFEAWNEFRRNETRGLEERGPFCWHCGQKCSGDVTETVSIDGQTAEVAVCEPTENGEPGC
jgi:hypothetical protein